MKYAICNETFGDWSFDRAFALAAECGYTGVEIAPFTLAADAGDVTPSQRSETVAQAAAAGLEVIGLHWLLAKTEGYYLTSPEADVRARTSEYLATLARLCRDLGGDVLVLGSPQQRNLLPGVSLDEATGYAADVLAGALPTLEQTQVTLALEPLGPSEGDFLLTAADAVALMKQIDSPHVRLHLDCKAMSSETDSIPDLLRRHRDEMVHFHANDPNRLGPGFGELDFRPIMAALREIAYDGWVSVEVFDYSPGAEVLARQSLENLRDALAAVA